MVGAAACCKLVMGICAAGFFFLAAGFSLRVLQALVLKTVFCSQSSIWHSKKMSVFCLSHCEHIMML